MTQLPGSMLNVDIFLLTLGQSYNVSTIVNHHLTDEKTGLERLSVKTLLGNK